VILAYIDGVQMSKARSTVTHGPEILLEVRPAVTSGDLAPRAAAPEEFKARADEIAGSISDVIDHLRPRLEKLLDQRGDSGWHVGSVEIEFGVSVQAETGVIIAKAAAGATFSARLVLQTREDRLG
jgi:NTP-dependent ternary system trypsin peptidase co-occuring protein